MLNEDCHKQTENNLNLINNLLEDQEFDTHIAIILGCVVVFQLSELSEAEDALAEANILNNSDPEVWAYLSLVCLKTGRQFEAEQAYKYAVKVSSSLDFIQ